jgi:hypothetical protein
VPEQNPIAGLNNSEQSTASAIELPSTLAFCGLNREFLLGLRRWRSAQCHVRAIQIEQLLAITALLESDGGQLTE